MGDQTPPGGWPLRMAITALVRPAVQTVAQQFRILEDLSTTHPASLTAARRLLWLEICERVQLHQLTARGFEHGSKIAVTIPVEFFNSATPDYEADTVSSHGMTYHGVRLFLTASREDRGNSTMPPPVELEAKVPKISGKAARNVGGATPKFDWEEFNQEAMRFANLDGFETRTQLRNHMKDWCARTWRDQPDGETLRRRIKGLINPTLPEK